MENNDNEENLLRSVALQNAQTILAARQRAEEELLQAKAALEKKTSELAHSLAMVRATLEATTDGILVTDNAGTVIDFNEKFVAFWRISPVILQQKLYRLLQDSMAAQCLDPYSFLAKEESIHSHSPTESVDILPLSDGRICERYSRLQVVDGASVGRVWTFRDVTQQRRVEFALREEGRILELLNKTGTAIASHLKLESLLQEITDAATELSGAKFGAFFHNSKGDGGEVLMLYTLSGASREAFEQLGHPRVTALFGPTFRGEPPIRSDDIVHDPRYGKWPPHHGMPPGHLPVRSYLAVPVVSRSGEVIGGLFFGHPEPGIFTERTERILVGIAAQAAVAVDNARLYEASQAAAAERSRLLDSERSARQLAEEQNRSKDDFLAMLGHELRNPLSAISAGVKVVQLVGPTSEKATNAYDIISRQTVHLNRIVDDLLDAARMLAGKISLQKQQIDLADAVKTCLAALETAGRTADHFIAVSLEQVLVDADPTRLEQIISNLLTNALRYTPSRGVISISVEVKAGEAVLTVSDNGIGMSASLIDRVFEPFVQGERSLDRSQGGLGIGLTLVRKLVELHGGSISLTSLGMGHGSTATVHLPMCAILASHTESTLSTLADKRRAKVLLIEDNPDAREMTSTMLQLSDYHVIQAENGMRGLELAAMYCPDVAVIDIGLPDLTGYEVAKRLRADIHSRDMRLIALTGYSGQEDVQRALDAGFDKHMAKPVNFSRLVSALELLTASSI
ncbi:ATP-binding protein [Noviherbaspirillum saxi]|uniref:histidine kinase n=1 Tax=Noviherbaspirillum saxi TaxID=2320863 RepID=A0A3A3GEE3_9BURK|nr:ATP-binding protein [Noviherbaspirillum saxi]RJF99269.1 response regulator [Noviherbaspirillum saxi]